jgi:hypothetical protein
MLKNHPNRALVEQAARNMGFANLSRLAEASANLPAAVDWSNCELYWDDAIISGNSRKRGVQRTPLRYGNAEQATAKWVVN